MLHSGRLQPCLQILDWSERDFLACYKIELITAVKSILVQTHIETS
jgi:hypothetical protein